MLRRGVDVVIGTPGRVKDHLERGTLNLRWVGARGAGRGAEQGAGRAGTSADAALALACGAPPRRPWRSSTAARLQLAPSRPRPPSHPPPAAPRPPPPRSKLLFRVLDECDEMLNMGFVDDVEKILNAGVDAAAVQTLLFSATLPSWVKQITARFLKPGYTTVDLVGTDKMKVGSAPGAWAAGRGPSAAGVPCWCCCAGAGCCCLLGWAAARGAALAARLEAAGMRAGLPTARRPHTSPRPPLRPPPRRQASTSVRHLLLPCHWSQRNQIVPDLVKCYGGC